jgi:putative Mn2+ efflux pump MntP
MVRLAKNSSLGGTETMFRCAGWREVVPRRARQSPPRSMSPLAIAIIAFSMSADAFAASLVKGAGVRHPHLREALRTGLIFGVIETVTPLIGWVAGIAASGFIEAVDHWIALILLSLVGGRMIHESLRPGEREKPQRHSLRVLAVTAIGTSIDAMVVGVMLAFLDANIWIAAGAIGLATFAMTTIGFMIGHSVGTRLGSRAEFVGGCGLMLLGLGIFLEHMLGG